MGGSSLRTVFGATWLEWAGMGWVESASRDLGIEHGD